MLLSRHVEQCIFHTLELLIICVSDCCSVFVLLWSLGMIQYLRSQWRPIALVMGVPLRVIRALTFFFNLQLVSDMGARTCRCGGKWVGRPGDKRGRSTRPKRGRYRHEFSIRATLTVHFTGMAKRIWKNGTKQTSWNCKLVFEMLSWSTQFKDTSWSF